jgi:hypothetical protein
MTYLEVLLLTQERGEHILAQGLRDVITDAHRYLRQLDDAESAWKEDTEPGAPEKKWGKSGPYYIWKREELPPQ